VSLVCLLGWHSPSIASIARRQDRLVALCEICCVPLTKKTDGKWAADAAPDPIIPAVEPRRSGPWIGKTS
jgi:hypothetical protein